jgi:tripartite-type tricarboxylate transporter receptor subunit TctC
MMAFGKAILGAFMLASLSVHAGDASAQPYPTKPIRLIVPFTAGGVGDVVARILADRVGADLGQQIVIDNRPGASGVTALQGTARSDPDGYTFMQLGNIIVSHMRPDSGYDLLRDFAPIVGVGSVPLAIVVNAKSDIRTIADLATRANASNGALVYGSAGTGSVTHLAGVLLMQELKSSATHLPFRGNIGAIQAILGQQIELAVVTTADVVELKNSGEVRILAVTSQKRQPNLTDVPTMAELGYPAFTPVVWYGYIAPAKTPPAIISRLAESFERAGRSPELQAKLANLGLTVNLTDSAGFAGYLREESARWHAVIKDSNIQAN